MAEPSTFGSMMLRLRETCRYHTGYPKDLGPSRVIHFTSDVGFIELLKQGNPVVVAFTIRSNYTEHLDKVLEEAAAEFYPDVKFMRVECPKYPGFCIKRGKTEYPFIELFHTPNQEPIPGKAVKTYSVGFLPFNYDQSAYGFREFFKHYGIKTSSKSNP